MANMLFANNAATTLASGITNTDTSLAVAAGTGALFPSPSAGSYFYLTLANTAGTVEIVKCTARTTDTLTVTRAQDGTAAVTWNSGDKVELRLVRADLNNFGQLDSANTWASGQTFVAPVLGTPASGTLTNCTFPTLNQNTSGTAAGLSATLVVGSGGTGSTTLAANNVLLGNGTSALQVVAPGTSGNVLTSNGTTWTSAPAAGYAGFSTVIFASSGTWAVPAGVTRAVIWIIGGGGGAAYGSSTFYKQGGDGGSAVAYCTGISGTLTITIGAGGAAIQGTAGSGGTTSITGTGVSMSATGGTGAVYNVSNGVAGAGTVTTGTALKVYAGGGNANNYGRHPITTPVGTSGSTTTAAVSWSSSSATSAGMGGGLGTSSSSPNIAGCAGAVVIEY